MKFTDQNIELIRSGAKYVTRRPLKPQPKRPFETFRGPEGEWRSAAGVTYMPVRFGESASIEDRAGKSLGLMHISDVGCEPLHQMNDDDAAAEGAANLAEFREIWASIYGPGHEYAWEKNPWVWVIGFRVVEWLDGSGMSR